MAKCSQCGAEVRDGAKFCEICGAKIEEKPQPNVCPQCGQEVAPGQVFCTNCGCKLAPAQEQAPAPQPAPEPQPMPAPAPQPMPAPQPGPMYQQPYGQPYQQQPMPQQQPNNGRVTPLQLVRSLVLNIGVFIIYLLLFLPFVVPLINGTNYNFFSLLADVFNFSGVEGFSVTLRVITIFAAFLPLIGFLAYGTLALVSGIKGIIHKSMPRLEFLGLAIGMYVPMFLVTIGGTNNTNDIAGFSFTVFNSPAFVVLYVAFILYMVFGLAGSYLSAFVDKRTIAGPILKSVATVIGVLLFTFAFGATAATANNYKVSLSPMYLYQSSAYVFSAGGSGNTTSYGIYMFIHGLFYMISVEVIGLSMGELFSPSRRKANRVNAIVFTSISTALSVASIFAFTEITGGGGGSSPTLGMPSVCGIIVMILVIAFMILSNIAQNKERPALVRPQMMMQQPPQQPRYY